MKGKLYGVGVGPGDPKLLTLKAVEVIKNSDVIAVPAKDKHECTAYRIASGAVELDEKECLGIVMPMIRDREKLKKYHDQGARQLEEVLLEGKNVAFLTLGDPAVYSTYGYLQRRIAAKGYKTEMVSGIPSFCAAASCFNISLTERAEELHVIPAGYGVQEAMEFSGTKVFMKAGSRIGELKQVLQDTDAEVYMVENCGLEQEKKYYGVQDIEEAAGYYSLVIVKDHNVIVKNHNKENK